MDVLLCETGDGGDFIWTGSDFKLTDGFSNQVYLGWFGGNRGGDERDIEDFPQNVQRKDWWGNELLFQEDENLKFNSELETFLEEVALNSNNRIQAEEVASGDLDFMSDFGDVTIEARLIDVDKIKITAKIQQPDNEENKIFSFIWDKTKQEADCPCSDYVSKPETIISTGEYNESEYSSEEYST